MKYFKPGDVVTPLVRTCGDTVGNIYVEPGHRLVVEGTGYYHSSGGTRIWFVGVPGDCMGNYSSEDFESWEKIKEEIYEIW
jgi:hypothetical protein